MLQIEASRQGVPEHQYERLFDRFYRLDGDRHDSGKPGSGLGLAIVRHIVDLHDARIQLGQSSLADGLKIRIEFPIPTTGMNYEKS